MKSVLPPANPLYRITAVAILAVVVVRVAGYLVPSPLAWGIDYFSDLPFQFLAVYAFMGILLALWLLQAAGQDKPTLKIPDRYTSASVILPLAGLLFIIAALAFQVRLPLLGDSFILIQNYENTFKGMHSLHLGNEPAAHFILSSVIRLMGATTYPAMLSGFLTAEILLGAAFIALAFLAAGALQAGPRNRNLVFAAILSLPVMQVFFGYAEIYAVPAVAVMGYSAAALYYLNKRLRIEVLSLTLLIALFSHYLAVVLLPSLYYCFWRGVVRESKPPSEESHKLSPPVAVLQGVAVTAVAVWVLVSRESSGGHILSFTASASDQYQAYTLFSLFHLSELLNLAFLFSPFILLLLAIVLRGGWKQLIANDLHAFLTVAVAGYSAFLLVAKFDLGLAADWDVSVPYMSLAMLLAVSAILQKEGGDPERLACRRIVLAVIAMGFVQTLPWFYLNATVEPNLARSKRFLDPRTVSPDGNYQGHFHISYAYATLNKPDEAADVWNGFIAMYPNDWRGYQNYAHQAVAAGRAEAPATERAFERAFALDTARRMQREYSLYYTGRARTAFENGRADSTIFLLQRAIAIDSSNTGAWFNLASVYDAVGDIQSATLAYFDLLDRSPRFMPGYEGLTKDLLKLGSPEAAVEIGEKALLVNANDAAIHQTLAEAYKKLNRTADASRALNRAAQLGAKGQQ